MAEELIDKYIHRDGVKEDTDFMLGELNKLYASFKKVNELKISLGGASTFRQTGEAVTKLRNELDEMQRIEKDVIKTYEKRQAASSRQAKDLTLEKELLRQKNAELKNTIREETAATGSIEQMRAALIRMSKAYDNLSEAQRNAAEGQELKKKVSELSSQLKVLEGDTGRFQRNVGNYSQAVKTLERALGDVQGRLEEYNKSGKASVETIEALKREEGLLVNLVNSQVNGFASATAELKNNERALQALAAAGLQNSDFYKELLNQTAELKDSVSDLRAEITNLSSDTSTLDGLVGSAQALTGVYGAAEGAAALFGVANEDLQKTMVKLQAVQAVLAGLQALQNALQRESSVMLFLNTVRTTALTAALRIKTFVLSGATAAARTFNTALLGTGIGALLLLLPLATNAMQEFGDATDDATKDLEEQKKAMDELNERYLTQAEKSERARNAQKGGLDDLRRQLQLLEAAGASEARIGEARQKVLNKELENLRIKRATIDANGERELELDKEIADKQNEIRADQIATSKKISDDADKIAKERASKSEEYAEKERRAAFEILKLDRERNIESLKSQSEEEAFSLSTRIAARLEMAEQEREIAIAQKNFELSNTDLTARERELVIARSSAAIQDIESRAAQQIIAIRASVNDQEKKQIEEQSATIQEGIDKGIKSQIDSIARGSATKLEAIAFDADQELQVQLALYEKGKISKEQFEKEKLAIENKARRASLLAEITQQQKLLDILDIDVDTRAAAELKLAELRRQLNEQDVEGRKDAADKKLEYELALNERLKQMGTELQGLAFDLLTSGIEKQKNAVQTQIDDLEKKKQKDIEVANATITNEQQRAAAIAIIEARANAQKEAFERRKRQLDLEKAKFDRAKNIADVIQNTAVAVIGAFKTDPTGILAAIIGAIGAVQIARVLSTPLPKYKYGTNYHQGGAAIVGDGGEHELVTTPDGKQYVTPDTDTIVNLPKGSKVKPMSREEIDGLQMAMANKQIRTIMELNAMMQGQRTDDRLAVQANKLLGQIREELRAGQQQQPQQRGTHIREIWAAQDALAQAAYLNKNLQG